MIPFKISLMDLAGTFENRVVIGYRVHMVKLERRGLPRSGLLERSQIVNELVSCTITSVIQLSLINSCVGLFKRRLPVK